MLTLKDKNLGLFFSYNVSLKAWNDLGMLDREARIWSVIANFFKSISFISYGGREESARALNFPGIRLLNNRWNLTALLFCLICPFLYMGQLRKMDIFKVNQLSGALPAIISKILYRKKLVIRCGFQLSDFFIRQKESKFKILLALALERAAFFMADMIIVTTRSDCDYVISRHKVKANKIKIIPNGVDTALFSVSDKVKREPGRIIFVGRFIRQKNLFSLLASLKDLDNIHLVMIGQGELKPELEKLAQSYGVRVTFIDRVNNNDLPLEYNKAEIFVLPSYFEGNPKVMLEAMSCGLAVIGSDVKGINDIIKHGENGLLSDISPEGIREAILLLRDPELRKRLGEKARLYIEENFNLESLISLECGHIKNIL